MILGKHKPGHIISQSKKCLPNHRKSQRPQLVSKALHDPVLSPHYDLPPAPLLLLSLLQPPWLCTTLCTSSMLPCQGLCVCCPSACTAHPQISPWLLPALSSEMIEIPPSQRLLNLQPTLVPHYPVHFFHTIYHFLANLTFTCVCLLFVLTTASPSLDASSMRAGILAFSFLVLMSQNT